MHKKTLLLAAAVIAADFLPHQTLAQEATIKLDDLTVVGRATELTGVAGAASEGKVGHLELSSRPIFRAGEILEVIPGFIATQHSGTGKANQYPLAWI